MTDLEALRTRIVLAQSIGITPDSVKVIDTDSGLGMVLYSLDDFKGFNLLVGFIEVPTFDEAREKVKDLYLYGAEMEFDEEMKFI